ncbi:E3 ubiquitin-protein ligase ATL9-like [Miscanthus floridulus]|uniref:E3 ubiquitin-protein ligase ATL9-like n=1 Tax=Miscanthus floridulus TaxID=154761 RepID=UPI0034588D11
MVASATELVDVGGVERHLLVGEAAELAELHLDLGLLPLLDHHAAAAGGRGGPVVHPDRRARGAGLDREVVESFPTAVYGDVRVAAKSGPSLECAVCLAAFEDRNELRVLSACCHVFHPDCIDP